MDQKQNHQSLDNCKKIELKEYETVCDKCNGTGIYPPQTHLLCPKCQGEKKLDWVSVITGVAAKSCSSSEGSSSGCSSCSGYYYSLPSKKLGYGSLMNKTENFKSLIGTGISGISKKKWNWSKWLKK